MAEPFEFVKSQTAVEVRNGEVGGGGEKQPLLRSCQKQPTATSEICAKSLAGTPDTLGPSLLGLLAKIKCSICSYQFNI